MVVERGQIWWADLGPPDGSEPGFHRPILIVQDDAFNRSRLPTVIGVVLSTNMRLLDAPGNVLIPAKATGLPRDSVANVSQLITVDRDFLIELAGRVRGQVIRDVEHGLRLALGLQSQPPRPRAGGLLRVRSRSCPPGRPGRYPPWACRGAGSRTPMTGRPHPRV